MSRREFLDWVLFFFIGVIFAGVFTAFNPYSTLIIESNFSRSASVQVFWNSGNGFLEDQSSTVRMIPGEESTRVRIKENGAIRQLRLDPGKQPGSYFFSTITLSRDACLLPDLPFCSVELSQIAPVRTNQVKIGKGDFFEIDASGIDPNVVWSTERFSHRIWVIALLNIALLGVLFSFIGAVIKGCVSFNGFNCRRSIVNASWAFLIYPFYWVCAEVSARYFDRISIDKSVFFFSVFIFFSGFLLEFINRKGRHHYAVRLTLAVLLVGLISPEVLFHLGVLNQWRFGSEPNAYHWQINRSFSDNFNHSSLRYQKEITQIGELTEKESRFLSDRATSLYITASENIYLVNSMPHHRTEGSLSEGEMEDLCDTEISEAKFRSLMRLRQVSFLVINHDEQNPHVGRSCLTPVLAQLVGKYPNRFNHLFSGPNLSLYQLVR